AEAAEETAPAVLDRLRLATEGVLPRRAVLGGLAHRGGEAAPTLVSQRALADTSGHLPAVYAEHEGVLPLDVEPNHLVHPTPGAGPGCRGALFAAVRLPSRDRTRAVADTGS